jgi:hypothetical protein
MELLCIETHDSGTIIAGQVYVALGVKKCPCGCGGLLINVGVPEITIWANCCNSNRTYLNNSEYWWFREQYFVTIATDEEMEQYQSEKQLVNA